MQQDAGPAQPTGAATSEGVEGGGGEGAAGGAEAAGWGAVLQQRPSKLRPLSGGGAEPPRRGQRQPQRSEGGHGFSLMAWNALPVDVRGGSPLRLITMAEVREHRSLEDDAWTVFRGKVYQLSPYVPYHPGGAEMLRAVAGKDCTALFEQVRSCDCATASPCGPFAEVRRCLWRSITGG